MAEIEQEKKKRSGLLITMIVSVMLVTTLAVSLLITYRSALQRAESDAVRMLRDTAKEQALTLRAILDGQFETLSVFAGSMAMEDELVIEDVVHRMNAVTQLSSFLNILYIQPDGKAYDNTGTISDLSERNYFLNGMNGTRSIEKIIRQDSNLNRIILSTPIVKNEQVIGVMSGVYNESVLQDLVIPTIYGGEGYSVITDIQGNFMVSSGAKNALFVGENLFSSLGGATMLSDDSVDSIRQRVSERKEGSFTYRYRGNERYVVYEPLNIGVGKYGDWVLYNVVPGSVIDTEVDRISRDTAVMIFLVMMACVVAFLIVIRREQKMMELLTEEHRLLALSEQKFRLAANNKRLIIGQYDFHTHELTHDDDRLRAENFPEVLKDIPQSLIDKNIIWLESRETLIKFCKSLPGSCEPHQCVVGVNQADGGVSWLQINSIPIDEGKAGVRQVILTAEDISEQRQKEIIYKRWQQSFENVDLKKYTLYRYNLSSESSVAEAQGELLDFYFSPDIGNFDEQMQDYAERRIARQDRDKFLAEINSNVLLADYYRGKRSCVIDYREIDGVNESRWLQLRLELVEHPNSSDVEAYLMFENINEEKIAELQKLRLAETDSLTGLLNRKAYEDKVDNLIMNTKPGIQHAFMMVDIDHFKTINDTYGHSVGDQALITVANFISSVLRHGDLVCRFGGDEFMVCLQDISYYAVIEKKAKQLGEALRKVDGEHHTSTVSIGIALYPRDGEDFETLYHHMDAALYRAKDNGRDCFVFYNKAFEENKEESSVPRLSEQIISKSEHPKRLMLIVDDMETDRRILARIFSDDFNIITAESGGMALSQLKRFGASLSIVLLDLIMPGLNGFTVLERIQKSDDLRNIPVVVITGDDNQNNNLRAIEAGAIDFVLKPVDPNMLRLRVEAAIKRTENERVRVQDSFSQLQSDEEARYRAVLNSTDTTVLEYNVDSDVFLFDSQNTSNIAGEFGHGNLWTVLRDNKLASPQDIASMQRMVNELSVDKDRHQDSIKVQLLTKENKMHWYQFRAFNDTSQKSLTQKLLLTFTDINEEELAEQLLRFQAERDDLTGLYNRNCFIAKAAELVSKAPPNTYALTVIDIDNFKIINDRFGHDEGDKLLIAFGESIYNHTDGVRGVCGRMNSDVFAALQPNNPAWFDSVNEQRQQELHQYPLNFEITFSCGRYLVEDPTMSVDSMLDRAVMALEYSKKMYGVHSLWYDESMRQKLLDEQDIIGDIDRALKNEEFAIYLQPQFDHSNGKLVATEALVRWFHPDKGLISPNTFIPLFEKNGLVSQLDEYIWDHTAELLHNWIVAGYTPVPVSVNVSRIDTYDPFLTEKLLAIVEKYKIPIDLFRIEITESAFMERPDRMVTAVERLHESGFTIEMDDFGSGYSSLNILKEVPVDIIKLDMKFFSDSGSAERGGIILNAVMRMTQWLNIFTIAEGVETSEQADFLLSIGCRVIQGYLYARPMSADAFEKMLVERGSEKLESENLIHTNLDLRTFWDANSADSELFNNYIGAAVICEYHNHQLSIIRSNEQFYELMHLTGENDEFLHPENLINPDDHQAIRDVIKRAIIYNKEESVVMQRVFSDRSNRIWIRARIRLVAHNEDTNFLLFMLEDISEIKNQA